jgi:hypothetical protein
MRLIALSVAAIIDCDHLESVRECLDYARRAPVYLNINHKPVDQQNGFTFALHDVMDLHSCGIEKVVLCMQERNGEDKEDRQKQSVLRDDCGRMLH